MPLMVKKGYLTRSMTLDNFTDHIPKTILERGREYYENGNVTKLSEKKSPAGKAYSAVVEGTERYSVFIQISKAKDEIVFRSCTCPYDGSECKHVAAVLYTIIEGSHEGKPAKQKNITTDKILDQLSESELKEYMRQLLEDNREIKKHFTAVFTAKIATGKNDYRALITQSIQGLRGARSFSDGASVHRAMIPVHKILEQAKKSLHAGKYEQVADITQAVMEKLVPALQYIDDSNGYLSDCISEAVHLLYLLAESDLPQPLRKDLFTWFLKSATNKVYTEWDWCWDFARLAVIMSSPKDEPRIIAMATTMRKTDDDDQWGKQYNAQQVAELLLVFHEKHKTQAETDAFIQENIRYPGIRKLAITRLINKQDMTQALALCREGVVLSKEQKLPGLVNDWYKMMLEIHQLQKNKVGIIECAEFLFLNSHLELSYYNLLKKEMSEKQWAEKQPSYLNKLEQQHQWHSLAVIFSAENQQDKLMTVLRMSRHIPLIKEFQKHLLPGFKDALQQLYFGIVSQTLERYPDRNHYHEVAVILKEMKSQFDILSIQVFVIELREKYRKRAALLDELKNL
jgi:hypothetical protein